MFSPNWHKPSDTLGNCNVPYLRKVVGGALATLAEQLMLPYPQNLVATSSNDEITLKWKPSNNAFLKGVNVYRSETSGSGYQKINAQPVSGSVYRDMPALLNKTYYYYITTVNDSLQESAGSNEVAGARFNFCDTLLVLANVKGVNTTPDSLLQFYKTLLDTIPHKWIDINEERKVNLVEFSRYRNIFWMSNSIEFEAMTMEMAYSVLAFIENGGNLLFAGFTPGYFWTGIPITTPLMIPAEALFHKVFKVDTVEKKTQCMLFRANSVADGYNTLNIDSLKYMEKSYPGQIFNVEVFSPAEGGEIVYKFDSRFDSTSSLGKMKGRPVGLEYMGTDHKSILLSFPLYYLDTTDAQNLLQYVITRKFGYPLGVSPFTTTDNSAFKVYPNPVKSECNVTFTLDQPGRVRLSLFSISGQRIGILLDGQMEAGRQGVMVSTASLAPGLYEMILEHGSRLMVKKVIRIE